MRIEIRPPPGAEGLARSGVVAEPFGCPGAGPPGRGVRSLLRHCTGESSTGTRGRNRPFDSLGQLVESPMRGVLASAIDAARDQPETPPEPIVRTHRRVEPKEQVVCLLSSPRGLGESLQVMLEAVSEETDGARCERRLLDRAWGSAFSREA